MVSGFWKSTIFSSAFLGFFINLKVLAENLVRTHGQGTMNAEKEVTYKERLLVANRAQIKKQQTNPQSLEAISTQEPLTQIVLQGEAWTELPASVLNCLFTLFLPLSQSS